MQHSKRRKENRLNLRFGSTDEIDALEVFAHGQGLTLPAWAKQTLLAEPKRHLQDALLSKKALESSLLARKLLEFHCEPSDVAAATVATRDYIEKVEAHVTLP